MKTFLKLFSLIVVCCLFLPTPVPAQEQGQDSPYIGRIPGYTIKNYRQQFDRMAPLGNGRDEMSAVMGTYTEIEYQAEESVRQSPLAISMAYTNKLQSMGAEILGSGDTWGSYLLHVDGKNVYINLNVWGGGSYYGLFILEEGDPNPQLTPPANATDSAPQTPTSAAPAQNLLPPG